MPRGRVRPSHKSLVKLCVYGGMNPINPKLRQIAEAIVASEVQPGAHADLYISSCLDMFKKIQVQMASLMGGLGFNAVISRALLLAQHDSAWLQFLKVNPDGSLEYAGDAESKWENTSVKAGAVALLSESSVRAGAVALLAELLELLAAFIGETLTLHLLGEIWPALQQE